MLVEPHLGLALPSAREKASERAEHCRVAKECGGCAMIGLSERAELDQKLGVVAAELSQVGVGFPEPRWVRSGLRVGYRNRLRLRVGSDGTIGYFNQGKADECSVLEPELGRLIVRLKDFALAHREWLCGMAHVEVRSPDADGRGGILFSPGPKKVFSESAPRSLAKIGPDVLVAIEGIGSPHLVPRQRRMLAEDVYCYVPLDAFAQVNTKVNLSLCAVLRSLARSHGVTSALDLYAGSGNFSLPLLRDGIRVAAVESRLSAAHALELGARVQRLGPVELVAGDAASAAEAYREHARQWDLVVIDAPRAGVRHGLRSMACLVRRHIAVVSCNPRTLARDLRALSDLGFVLRQLFLFDMFPQTRHVELLAWLSHDEGVAPGAPLE